MITEKNIHDFDKYIVPASKLEIAVVEQYKVQMGWKL